MDSQKSQIQRSLDTILIDQPYNPNAKLTDIFDELNFKSKSQEIKRNMNHFIQDCLINTILVPQMIARSLQSDTFNSNYQKCLALFSVQVLCGEYGDSYKLFIQGEQEVKSIRKSKSIRYQQQIQQQIEGEAQSAQDKFAKKYSNFEKLIKCVSKVPQQIPETCMNYFNKIMTNIASNRAQDVYAYFSQKQNNSKLNISNDQKPTTSELNYIIEHVYNFGGVGQVIGKLLAQQGSSNKYLQIKKLIIEKIILMLKSDDLLKSKVGNYDYLIQFVNYLLSRTKYKSDDRDDQLSKIAQRFVQQDIIWYFKEKAIRAVCDSNNLLTNGAMNSSGNINRSESSKSIRKESELKSQNQQQFYGFQKIFVNSINYMKVIIQRINSEQEQNEKYGKEQQEKNENVDSIINFQIDEVLYGQNSLYQLFTLYIPFKYKNINKMLYYEFLLKLSRNSRFKKVDLIKQVGLLPSSVVPILIHLLKVFRRQIKHNGLTNLYIEQLATQAILSKIQKFDNKEAMMVLSALNPSEAVVNQLDDTRAFLLKILIIMDKKCEWFKEHFSKLGINITLEKQKFQNKLGGGHQNTKKSVAKQFQFLYDEIQIKEQPKQLLKQCRKQFRREKSQKFQDEDSSEQDFKDKCDNNDFSESQKFQKVNKITEVYQPESQTADLQQNLFKDQFNEISQKAKIDLYNPIIEKQTQIQLYVDSAGSSSSQQNQVIRQQMNQETS